MKTLSKKTLSQKRLLVAFWIVNGSEALATLLILMVIPPDPKNALLGGFSLQRLTMFSGSALLSAIFGGLAWMCAVDHPMYRRGSQLFHDRALAWLIFFGALAAVAGGWLLFVTPPQIQGAVIERLRP